MFINHFFNYVPLANRLTCKHLLLLFFFFLRAYIPSISEDNKEIMMSVFTNFAGGYTAEGRTW